MNKYEILYVCKSGLEEQAYQAIADKYSDLVTASGGLVESVDKWGTKKLAYAINYKNDGYFIVMKFEAAASFPAEIQRNMKISDDIIRYVVTLRK